MRQNISCSILFRSWLWLGYSKTKRCLLLLSCINIRMSLCGDGWRKITTEASRLHDNVSLWARCVSLDLQSLRIVQQLIRYAYYSAEKKNTKIRKSGKNNKSCCLSAHSGVGRMNSESKMVVFPKLGRAKALRYTLENSHTNKQKRL